MKGRKKLIFGAPAGLLLAAAMQAGTAVAAHGAACSTAGGTGLTAAVVATAGQEISGTVNAAGCDVGVYVGPGADGVTITDATITGANDQGVVAQDVTGLMLMHSTVTGNGTAPNAAITDNKAVTLAGTTGAVVHDNVIADNAGGGGLALTDDGALSPPALAGHPGSLHASRANLVMGNDVHGNLRGCGIVLAAWNPGAGLIDNVVSGNQVRGALGAPPAIGAIVVATDAPFTTAVGNSLIDNVSTNSAIPGLIVHSNAPGDLVSGTVIRGNHVDSDDFTESDGPVAMVGISVRANTFPPGVPPAVLIDTLVTNNWITNEDIGVWISGATDTHVAGWGLNKATMPMSPAPQHCGNKTTSANC